MMMNRVIRLIFAIALAGFSTNALVSSAFADDKPKKEEKADKADKKKKSDKKEEEKSGW